MLISVGCWQWGSVRSNLRAVHLSTQKKFTFLRWMENSWSTGHLYSTFWTDGNKEKSPMGHFRMVRKPCCDMMNGCRRKNIYSLGSWNSGHVGLLIDLFTLFKCNSTMQVPRNVPWQLNTSESNLISERPHFNLCNDLLLAWGVLFYFKLKWNICKLWRHSSEHRFVMPVLVWIQTKYQHCHIVISCGAVSLLQSISLLLQSDNSLIFQYDVNLVLCKHCLTTQSMKTCFMLGHVKNWGWTFLLCCPQTWKVSYFKQTKFEVMATCVP